ncbi:MAG: TatD family hydrolase, partial [Patescibacteria group bacterium]
AGRPKVVAIGECGLDYNRIRNQELGIRERQKEVFVQQIELAKELKKPLVIHCRKAFDDLIQILDSLFLIPDSPAGVVHFFSGSWDDAKSLLDLGFYLSFGGVITFARDYDQVVKHVPLERLLIETDAPYVAPLPYRGKRNEPLYISEVAKKIVELKAITFEEVADTTTANAVRLFQLPGP